MTNGPSPVSSLTVLGGPLDATSFVIEPGSSEVLIGTDAGCQLCVDLPAVGPIHARLAIDPGGVSIHDAGSGRSLYVNDDRVVGQAPLRDGDVIWLGAPGEPDSVMIQCRLRAPQSAELAAGDEVFMVEAEASPPAGGEEFFIAEPAPEPAPSPADEFLVVPASEEAPAAAGDVVLDEAPGGEAPEAEAFFVEEAPATPEAFFVEEPAAPSPPAPAPAPPPPAPAPAKPAPPAAAPAVPKPTPPAPAPPAPPPTAAPPPPRPAAPAATPAPKAASARPASQKYETGPPEIMPSRERIAPSVGPAPAAVAGPRRPRAKPSRPVGLYAAAGIAGLIVVGGGGYFALQALRAPKLEALSPTRARVGQPVTLRGKNFAETTQGNVVLFGEKASTVLKATPTSLEVEVPELPTSPGRDIKVQVTVKVGPKATKPVEIGVYQTPRIHGLSPDIAMPGEEVVLAGAGWGPGAGVRFGDKTAEVVETTTTAIKVRVPALDGEPGTSMQVVVTMGADASNAAPFLLGRLPLVSRGEPQSVAPGDMVTVTGRGFNPKASANVVKVAGAPALVVSATESELKVVVPRVPAGQATLDLRVPGSENVGQAGLTVTAPADPVDFRFVAEPFEDAQDHEHAVLATGLGPAFVISASGGRSAAERAFEAERRLNEAAVPLKAQRDADLEVRGVDTNPSIGLIAKPGAVLEVTEEDAAAYNEDWTKLGGKGGPVTRSRLALWWGAVARDLVLLLVRSDKPIHAAKLAPEGRVLGDVFQAARKTGRFGLPREVVDGMKPPVRDSLRIVALRVPAAVVGPAPAAGAAAGPAAVKLDGPWGGTEVESGARKYVSVNFKGAGGSLAYTGGVSVSMPLLGVEQQKGVVRYSLQFRGGTRYYVGNWDGQKLRGKISSDAAGKSEIGTFELAPGR